MLSKLIIKNFALIDYSEIEFGKGLNILSGETGSGKSILLESLNFVLGAKAEKNLIRYGEADCTVTAEFDVSNNELVKNLLIDNDFEVDDTIIITRKYSQDGKNSIKLNGNTINVSMLKKFTQKIVDVHGQSEHFFLLSEQNQLDLIDKFCGEKIIKIKKELENVIDEYNGIIKALDELGGEDSKREIRLDILKFQINEIESTNLIEDEEVALLENKKKVLNLQKIVETLNSVYEGISGEGNVNDILSNVSKSLSSIKEYSGEYSTLYDRIASVLCEITDISSTAESLKDTLDCDGLDINEIEERLDLIKTIKKKYGANYQEIMLFLQNAKEEKDKLEHFNELSSDLIIRKEKLEKEIYSIYSKISEIRKNTAYTFVKNVTDELNELGFNKADFKIIFNEFPKIEECKFTSKNGIDVITFMFSANIGEPVKPLSSVISGGEVSRFMLAIKAQTSKYNDISTFIFDEIDTGISGKIAKIVGEKFYKISLDTQIVAITHLPQIFVMGDNNFLINKIVSNEKTFSKITKLDNNGKKSELIRLIGGDLNSSNADKLATELITEANSVKNTLQKSI